MQAKMVPLELVRPSECFPTTEFLTFVFFHVWVLKGKLKIHRSPERSQKFIEKSQKIRQSCRLRIFLIFVKLAHNHHFAATPAT